MYKKILILFLLLLSGCATITEYQQGCIDSLHGSSFTEESKIKFCKALEKHRSLFPKEKRGRI